MTTWHFAIAGIFYLAALALIGWRAYRRTRSVADYVLASRRLGPATTGLSAGASDMSGWLLLGLPGLAYLDGRAAGLTAAGLLAGSWLSWRLIAPRLRAATATLAVVTLPGFLARRLDARGPALRRTAALAILVFLVVYAAAGFVAAARLLESVLGLPYHAGLGIGAVVIVLYTAGGGFLAVTWTDVAQAVLMLLALVSCAAIGLAACGEGCLVGGGEPPSADAGLVASVSALAWGLGYFGQPHILARYMAIADPRGLVGARRLAIGWAAAGLLAAVAVGVAGRALVTPALDGAARETVFLVLLPELMPPLIAAFAVTGVMAAIMSTVDSQLLVAATTVTHDLAHGTRAERSVWLQRATVTGVSGIALAIALDPDNQILDLVGYAWAGFGAALGPPLLLSLWWPGTRAAGALAGVVTGVVVVIGWEAFLAVPTGVYEIVPAFLLATLAVVGVSRAAGRPGAPAQGSGVGTG